MFGRKTKRLQDLCYGLVDANLRQEVRIDDLERDLEVKELNEELKEYFLEVVRDYDMYKIRCFLCDDDLYYFESFHDVHVWLAGYKKGYEDNEETNEDFNCCDGDCDICNTEYDEPEIEILNTKENKKSLNSKKTK